MVSWSVLGGRVLGPAPFLIAGIVNLTPDSFYDGGRYNTPDAGADKGRLLLDQGAHVLDLGGESTRPFSTPVDAEAELGRLMPVIRKILAHEPRTSISVDTYKAQVADTCLRAGAVIINDISACRFDPDLLEVLVSHKPGYVLMHALDRPANMQKDPQYRDVVSQVMVFFETHLRRLVQAGLPEERIVLDPGIGFGKTVKHNLELLKNIERFQSFGRPLLVGLSYKSVWGTLLGLGLEQRGLPTQVAVALMAAKGVAVHRVHDVHLTRNTLKIVKNICS